MDDSPEIVFNEVLEGMKSSDINVRRNAICLIKLIFSKTILHHVSPEDSVGLKLVKILSKEEDPEIRRIIIEQLDILVKNKVNIFMGHLLLTSEAVNEKNMELKIKLVEILWSDMVWVNSQIPEYNILETLNKMLKEDNLELKRWIIAIFGIQAIKEDKYMRYIYSLAKELKKCNRKLEFEEDPEEVEHLRGMICDTFWGFLNKGIDIWLVFDILVKIEIEKLEQKKSSDVGYTLQEYMENFSGIIEDKIKLEKMRDACIKLYKLSGDGNGLGRRKIIIPKQRRIGRWRSLNC